MDDNLTMVFKIEKEIKETEEEFIYSTIYPFCEQVVEHKLSKKELEEIINKSMEYDDMLHRINQTREDMNKLLDQITEAIEEIDDLNRYYDNDPSTNNYDAMFKCDEVFSILNKLVER